ncbi:MAG: tetratricopeptide repeat protein [Desulfovibrio sp.]
MSDTDKDLHALETNLTALINTNFDKICTLAVLCHSSEAPVPPEVPSSTTNGEELLKELIDEEIVQVLPGDGLLAVDQPVKTTLIRLLSEEQNRKTAQATISAYAAAFPNAAEEKWTLSGDIMPHMPHLAQLIHGHGLFTEDAGRLLQQAAYFLYFQGNVFGAEPLLRLALTAAKKKAELNAQQATNNAALMDIAVAMDDLGVILKDQNKNEEALELFLKAQETRDAILGEDHPASGPGLNNIALLYFTEGKTQEAEKTFLRLIDILEKEHGKESAAITPVLNNIALVYEACGHYKKAEALATRALKIDQTVLGTDHPDVATDLNNLALLKQAQGDTAEALQLLGRALSIRNLRLGENHTSTGNTHLNIAQLTADTENYAGAERHFRKALTIFAQSLGPDHPSTLQTMEAFATTLEKAGQEDAAQTLRDELERYRQANENVDEEDTTVTK